MPFSLTNAPTVFQWFMNDIFSNLLNVCVIIYLDDILIYLNNMSEYYQHIKEVLMHLCKAGLYAKVEKCKFHSELVEYLEYILSSSGLLYPMIKWRLFKTGQSLRKSRIFNSS